jgi:hypothetical protein
MRRRARGGQAKFRREYFSIFKGDSGEGNGCRESHHRNPTGEKATDGLQIWRTMVPDLGRAVANSRN